MTLDTRMFTSTVARRTFALFVTCALVPVCALAGLAFYHVAAQLQEQAHHRLHQASKTVAMVLMNRLLAADTALAMSPDPRRTPVGGLPAPLLGVMLSSDDGTDRVLVGAMARRPTLTAAQLASLQRGNSVLSVDRDAGGPVLLTVITGHTHLLRHDLAADDPRRKRVETIDATAESGPPG
jgi:hypothetical protein